MLAKVKNASSIGLEQVLPISNTRIQPRVIRFAPFSTDGEIVLRLGNLESPVSRAAAQSWLAPTRVKSPSAGAAELHPGTKKPDESELFQSARGPSCIAGLLSPPRRAA